MANNKWGDDSITKGRNFNKTPNAQVATLLEKLPDMRIGTVDKFQELPRDGLYFRFTYVYLMYEPIYHFP